MGCGMTCIGRVTPFLLAVVLVAAGGYSARAEVPGAAGSELMLISYEDPTDANLRPYYNELKRRHVLERLWGFMSPLRLPKPLGMRTAQCGTETMPYKLGGPVTICYEMVQHVATIAAKNTNDPIERAQILYGTFVEAALHQVAYAVFDELQVPIWGRKDDAADHLAALIMMAFGDKIALTTILGTTKFFEYSGRTWTGADFARTDSPEAQRFYNYLCIAYGGDPITFSFLKPRRGPSPGSGTNASPRLSEYRAERCYSEYLQVRHAFDLRIMPYVDPDRLVKVRATKWLQPDEVPEAEK